MTAFPHIPFSGKVRSLPAGCLTAVLLLLFPPVLRAQEEISLPLSGQPTAETEAEHILPMKDRAAAVRQSLLFLPGNDFTAVEVLWQQRGADEAVLPAEGRALGQGALRAFARHRLDSLHRVEGYAGYERGVKRGVNFCSSSDWRLNAPYITVDTAGGDLQREQYRFRAHFAGRKGAFLYGVKADYRALHEYRDFDPRPRNITDDLFLSLSGGLRPGSYALSAEVGYRRYHQSNEVVFKDTRGYNTDIFHWMGAGRRYGRFSGSAGSMAVRFRGDGLTAALNLEPCKGRGWTAGASYEMLNIVRRLKNQNETPISELLRQSTTLHAGWKWVSEAFSGHIGAEGGWLLRQGTEIVTGQTGAYAALTGLPLWRDETLRAALTGLARGQSGRVEWFAEGKAEWTSLRVHPRYPAASADLSSLGGWARGGCAFHTGRWELRGTGTLGLCKVMDTRIHYPQEGIEALFLEGYHQLARAFCASSALAGLSLQGGRKIGGDLSLYLRADARCRWWTDRHYQFESQILIGITF